MKRTKIWSYTFGVTMVLSLAGCGNSAKKQVNEKMNADSMSVISNQVGLQEDSALSTLVLDGVKATWIRDNASAKLMPPSLFPDAGEDLMKKLSLENGIPSSISMFLIESNGIQILFDIVLFPILMSLNPLSNNVSTKCLEFNILIPLYSVSPTTKKIMPVSESIP